MFSFFTNNMPIENYILSSLKKNKYNLELAYNEIYCKYPFWKKAALKNIISEILKKQINGEKISGIWSKIERKWLLVPVANKPNKIKSESLPWSGQDLPASEDPSSLGYNGGTYSRPNGPPRNKQLPEPKYNNKFEEVEEVEVDMNKVQQDYDKIFDNFKSSFENLKEFNDIITQELKKKYGDIVINLKLREQI